jgi:phosphatidylglycerol---prolipoprotein diacylglyceryl transferase
MLVYPDIDPIALQIGPFALRWYGLAYMAGFVSAFFFLKSIFIRRFKLTVDDLLDYFSFAIAGVILGGRLGYVLFYDLSYFMEYPSSIFSFWQGGMSYHGGALGAMLGTILFAKRRGISLWRLLDLLGISSTFGLFFGRISNFVNGELYGRVTTFKLGMVFPGGGELPRHPSQLYESFFEGIVLFLVLFGLMKSNRLKDGQLFGAYVFGYGLLRFFIEYTREPDAHLGFVLGSFSMGQVLSFGMVLIGSWIFLSRYFQKA